MSCGRRGCHGRACEIDLFERDWIGTASPAGRIVGIYSFLIVTNLLAWIWAFMAFAHQPVLIGTAVLAYSLGLRHAIDADHIAAIDNVTRKLMQEGKRPVAVGFFFALGHSTVVLLASLVVALTANALSDELVSYRAIGGIIGTLASALFLFLIAIANIVVLRGVYQAFRLVERGGSVPEADIDALLQQRGWLARLFRPLFRFVSHSWQLYPIGLLFALGFETASEISLFGLSAQASNAISSWSLLIFPALFAAGMTLVDTTDGVLMLGAYGWAYRNPLRKLFYNLTITSVSVLVALVVGGIETLGLVAGQLHLHGVFWDAIAELNDNFGVLGYAIVGLFVVSWAISFLVYRLKKYHLRMILVSGVGVPSASFFVTAKGRAADLPVVKAMPFKAPAPIASYDWSGFYVGGHVGYDRGSGHDTLSDPGASAVESAFGSLLGGMQFGYNYVLPSRLLVGIEGDSRFPNYLDDGIVASRSTPSSSVTEKLDFVSTVRGRAGYAFDHWLFYATGGVAWSQSRFLEDSNATGNEDKVLRMRAGWALGAGAELAIAPGWSARLEYLYDHLGKASSTFPSGTAYNSTTIDVNTVRLGLNRKLDWTGPNMNLSSADNSWALDPNSWNVHGQLTFIEQGYPAFHSPYQGANSLTGANQIQNTTSATAFVGYRPWDGTEIYVNPELMQGFGLDNTLGVAGFPNGEAQKSNFPIPRVDLARVFRSADLWPRRRAGDDRGRPEPARGKAGYLPRHGHRRPVRGPRSFRRQQLFS